MILHLNIELNDKIQFKRCSFAANMLVMEGRILLQKSINSKFDTSQYLHA